MFLTSSPALLQMKPSELHKKAGESLQRGDAISLYETQVLSECKNLGILDLVNQLSKGESADMLEEDLRRRIYGYEPLLKTDEPSPPVVIANEVSVRIQIQNR